MRYIATSILISVATVALAACSATRTKSDTIRVHYPAPHEQVSAVIPVEGEARGTWFFEASFPVRLEDANGNIIVQTHAEAEGEWMTEDFVPFYAEIQLTQAYKGEATLVLEKDNPSGLPENADEIRIPVTIDTGALSNDERSYIEEYIRGNIGELSPVDPVLGGSFYVVNIDWEEGNTAVITYEDGHIQVKAKAEIHIGENGDITLDNFTVIDE